jgi:hypothetical protein
MWILTSTLMSVNPIMPPKDEDHYPIPRAIILQGVTQAPRDNVVTTILISNSSHVPVMGVFNGNTQAVSTCGPTCR